MEIEVSKFKDDQDFLPITEDMIEGRDYISLYSGSKTIIGKGLAFTSPRKFNTFIGEVSGIRRFVIYLSTKGLPMSFLTKGRYNKEDHLLVKSNEPLTLTNYWAIVCYALCERVRQDKPLVEMIKNNTLPLTVVHWKKNPKILNDIASKLVCVNQTKLAVYLSIVRNIEMLIKEDMFNSNNINKLIKFYMKDASKDLFDGSIVIGSNIIK